MAKSWTPAQQEAISARNADLLVAAAAGSGKTAVLVERIIERITDKEQPVDLDRLLVVTFTNAAAAEMRERISGALESRLEKDPQNELLLHQSALLPRASITTIHAFCHKILRTHFHLLGLDPGFSLADPTENELIRLEALDEVIEELYEDPLYSDAFLQLTEAYLNIKNPDGFYGMVNHIYDFAMSLPNPEQWLYNAAEKFLPENNEDFNKSEFAHLLLLAGKETVRTVIQKYERMLRLADADDGGANLYSFLLAERVMFEKLLLNTTYSEFYNALSAVSFRSVPMAPKNAQPRYREEIRALRETVKKKEVKCLKEELFLLNGAEQKELFGRLYPVMRCLSETVIRLMRRFDEKKNEKNLLNYNDLEHGCYRLFTDENGKATDLAESVKEQFDEILIDEYQDTSALQEAIFSAIKKESGLFLVGDVKQSIYRFRNTNPLLFREKKDRFREEQTAKERKIILSKNFRSRKTVLDAVNFIFMRLMSPGAGEVDYNKEEMLYPGAVYPDMSHPLPGKTELYLVEMGEDGKKDDDPDKTTAEAIVTAQRIKALIDGGYQVLSKDGVRNIRYRDICILLRSTKNIAATFAETLAAFGIPCYSEAGSSFLQSEEITVMLSLLKIIDNPHQDIPLLAVLRSQLFALMPDDLASIRLKHPNGDFYDAVRKRAADKDALGKTLTEFLLLLKDFRLKNRELNTAELVWYVYMQTGFYEAQATLPGGTLRRLNLRLLYTRAAAFEKTGLKGLYSFIRFIDEYQSIGGDYDAARSIGEEQDVVRIMSIHKSKGLEFPVVILAGVGKEFNTRDLQGKVLIHSELGYGPEYVDTDLGIEYNNGARAAVKQAMHNEMLSEEMRILYVAMTRAREKLILLGSGKKLADQAKKCAIGGVEKRVSAGFALTATSYLDWLFMALLPHPDFATLRSLAGVEMSSPVDAVGEFLFKMIDVDSLSLPEQEIVTAEEKENEELLERLMPLINHAYTYESETGLPAKVTVTEVKRKLTDSAPDSVYLYPRPAFLKKQTGKLSPMEQGTALHTVLEHLDFSACETLASVCQQIEMMQTSGLLTEEETGCVSAEKIYAFVHSSLGKRLQNAKEVRREVSFSIAADGKELLGQPGHVMLQGMIDCVLFEDDGITIIDYKTDREDSAEAIKSRYGVQVACYKKATEIIFSQKVKGCYIYLFSSGDVVEVS